MRSTAIQRLLSPLMLNNETTVFGGKSFSRDFALLKNRVVLFVPDDRCADITITVTQQDNTREEEKIITALNKTHDQIFSEVAFALNETLDNFNHNEMKDFLNLYGLDI